MLFTEAPLGPARGSQPGAQAGRRPGWARNCDRFKIAARTMAIGCGSQPAHFGAASAKIRTPMGKTRGKTTRESSKSGEKWRFFEGPSRQGFSHREADEKSRLDEAIRRGMGGAAACEWRWWGGRERLMGIGQANVSEKSLPVRAAVS